MGVALQPPEAEASLEHTHPKVLRQPFYQTGFPKFKDTLYYFLKVLTREKAVFIVSCFLGRITMK